MSRKLFGRSLAGLVLVFGFAVPDASGQFVVDLSVDVSQVDDMYTYTYTATNQLISAVGMNILFLTVENGAEIDSVTGPEGWTSDYDPAELNLQVFSIAGDGFTVDDEQFDVVPGQSGIFTITSSWAPGEQDYLIGKLLPPDFAFGGEVGGVILAPTVRPDLGLACDFNNSGACDLADIDLLGTAIASGDNEAAFDLTDDQLVNGSDLDAFLAAPEVNKLNGDVNFDGTVGFPDFLVVADNFGDEGVFVWSEGDFSPNGQVDFADFLVLSSNFGDSAGASAAAVPEPCGVLLAFLGLLGGVCKLRGGRKLPVKTSDAIS